MEGWDKERKEPPVVFPGKQFAEIGHLTSSNHSALKDVPGKYSWKAAD
jgi:hypothetical protein